MDATLDLNILPVARKAGQEQADLPDLFVAERPRRAARGRQDDRLIIYLSTAGNAPLGAQPALQIFTNLAKTYYQTSGSVTSALRAVVDSLNEYVFDRNLRSAAGGSQVLGLLTLFVLREDRLYLAQSGPVQAYLIRVDEVQQVHDAELSGRGLGLSKTATVRYFQASLKPNDTLVFGNSPVAAWSAGALAGLFGQGLESIRRRLLDQVGGDLNAALIQARPGKGEVALLRATSLRQPAAPPATAGIGASGEISQPGPPPAAAPLPRVEQDGTLRPPESVPQSPPGPVTPQREPAAAAPQSVPAAVSSAASSATGAVEGEGAVAPKPTVAGPTPGKPPAPRKAGFSLVGALAAFGQSLVNIFQGVGRAGEAAVARTLPGESATTLSNATMVVIAIAVPLVVVTIASVFYVQRGLALQSQVIYEQAMESAQRAEAQTDPESRRIAWEDVLRRLDEADAFQKIPESASLRRTARSALDELELIKRLDYQPAVVGGLPVGSRITRLLADGDDLYLLDQQNGRVSRATLTSQGYQLDANFQCSTSAGADALVDMELWSGVQDPPATLLAMDAGGGLYFCEPGSPPAVRQLAPPASGIQERLAAFTQDSGNLYVLDPKTNAVWIYWESLYSTPPELFFNGDIPALNEAIDLAVNSNELYVLHSDGHLTLCDHSALGVAPTRCTDPLPYGDLRPGRENTPMTIAQPFSQVLYNPPPDPSLYFLEPVDQSIYLFSLRNLVYKRQYQPLESLPGGDATAFAVNPVERIFYLAVANNIYYARIQ